MSGFKRNRPSGAAFGPSNENRDVDHDSPSDLSDYDSQDEEGEEFFGELGEEYEEKESGLKIARDKHSNIIKAISFINEFTPSNRPCVIRRYSTIMMQSDPGTAKFLGYVRELFDPEDDESDDVQLRVCWFYRNTDIKSGTEPIRRKEILSDMLTRKARMENHKTADSGQFKEVFLTDHEDTVGCSSVMHPIKVWFLDSESVDPLVVDPTAAPTPAEATAASGSRPQLPPAPLLPGLVCRRFYKPQEHKIFPLSRVASGESPPLKRSNQLAEWVAGDVRELLRRSAEKRRRFMSRWKKRCRNRRRRAAVAEAAAAGAAQGAGPATDTARVERSAGGA